MEFLLINHPLDCPICDQGGECDLQDQAMAYGCDHSPLRREQARGDDKDLGPLVKTVMTRCIQCTRCVRFVTEVAGVAELGAISRGEHMEITTYVEKALTSELSGNVIDLCPVGALTSKPYAFNARPWELSKTEIDRRAWTRWARNIRVDARGREVMRVLPRINEDVNEEWISDKTRFAIDGLKRQRLDRPYVRARRQAAAGELGRGVRRHRGAGCKGVAGKRIAAIAGDLCDAESMVALKDLMTALGSPQPRLPPGRREARRRRARAAICSTPTIAGIEEADAILLVGTNPRWKRRCSTPACASAGCRRRAGRA